MKKIIFIFGTMLFMSCTNNNKPIIEVQEEIDSLAVDSTFVDSVLVDTLELI